MFTSALSAKIWVLDRNLARKKMARTTFCKAKAAEVMVQVKLAPPPPVDIEKVANEWGLRVEYVDRPAGLHGQVFTDRAVIEVATEDPPTRQHFTIAHELGHYVLKHNPVYSGAEPEEITDPRDINEREANIFAAELLMPEEWVREDWMIIRDARKMAGLYCVSDESMWYRLEGLRLIDF